MGEELTGRALERLALAGWPASRAVPYGDWLLRTHYGGVTKRANSVITLGDMPQVEAEQWLADIESHYRRERQLPCYYVSDHSPAGLDELLAAYGYQIAYPCMLMSAASDGVRQASRAADTRAVSCEHLAEADDRWLDEFLELEQFPLARRPAYVRLFADMGPAKTFLRAEIEGETAALGTAVSTRGWTIVYNIVTAERYRRLGAARAIMQAIAEWSGQQGADRLLLQVVRDNAPAIALYERLGFAPFCRQHYRIHPDEQ